MNNGSTRLYNVLMGNPSESFGSIGRVPRAGQSGGDDFFSKRFKSLENALGTTGSALISAVDTANENQNIENRLNKYKQNMDDIYKKYGYNSSDEYYDAKDAAEKQIFGKYGFDSDAYWNKHAELWSPNNTDSKELRELDASRQNVINKMSKEDADKIKQFDAIQEELKGQSKSNADDSKKASDAWRDYRENSYVGQKVNQDRGKFAGSAINTLSTMSDVLLPGAGVAFNAAQGGIEGIADELEQNGLDNFNLERAGQNALTGAVSGGVVGGLNKGLSGALAKRGGNLFKGGNRLTQGLNELGSNTALGRAGATLATGAGRGALSGAVGGATGAGLSAAMNGQDVLGSAVQGAMQGAQQGVIAGGVMSGVNMAANQTPGVGNVMRQLNEAGENWQKSGNDFNERLTNTLTSGDSRIGEWLQGNRQSRLLNTAGGIGNRIQDVSNGGDDNSAVRWADGSINEPATRANRLRSLDDQTNGDSRVDLAKSIAGDSTEYNQLLREIGDRADALSGKNVINDITDANTLDQRVLDALDLDITNRNPSTIAAVNQVLRERGLAPNISTGDSSVDNGLRNVEGLVQNGANAAQTPDTLGNWLQGRPSKLLSRAGQVGNSIRNVGDNNNPLKGITNASEAADIINNDKNLYFEGVPTRNSRAILDDLSTAMRSIENIPGATKSSAYQRLASVYDQANKAGGFANKGDAINALAEAENTLDYYTKSPNVGDGAYPYRDDVVNSIANLREDVGTLGNTVGINRLGATTSPESGFYDENTKALINDKDYRKGYLGNNPSKARLQSYNDSSDFIKRVLDGDLMYEGDDAVNYAFNRLSPEAQSDVLNRGRNFFSKDFMDTLGAGAQTSANKYVSVDPLGNRTEYTPDDIAKLINEYDDYQPPKTLSGNSSSEASEVLGDAGSKLLSVYDTMSGGNVGLDPVYNKQAAQEFQDWINTQRRATMGPNKMASSNTPAYTNLAKNVVDELEAKYGNLESAGLDDLKFLTRDTAQYDDKTARAILSRTANRMRDVGETRIANEINDALSNPTTLGGWLKKAGQRVVEDANNRGVGMSIKNVGNQDQMPEDIQNMRVENNTAESPETQVYRALNGEAEPRDLTSVFNPQEDNTIQGRNKLQSIGEQLQNAAKTQKYGALYDSLDSKTAARAVQTGAPEKLSQLGISPENYKEAAKTSNYINQVVSDLAEKSGVKINVPDLPSRLAADNLDILMSDTATKKYNNYMKQIAPDGDTPDQYSAGYLLQKSRELGNKAANLRGNTDDVYALRQALTDAKYKLRNIATDALEGSEITGDLTNDNIAKGLAQMGANQKVQDYYTEAVDGKAPSVSDYIRRSALFEQARDMGTQMEAEKFTRSASKAPTNPMTKIWNATGLDQPVNALLRNTVAPLASGVTNLAGKTLEGAGNIEQRIKGNLPSSTDTADTTPTYNPDYNPQTRLYNAIGRTEGLTNAEKARTANYLASAAQEAEIVPNNTLEGLTAQVPATGATSMYQSAYGQTPQQGAASSNSFFPSTGDYWTDILGVALTSAINANDVKAFGSLYEMYQDATAKLQKQANSSNSSQKLTATQQRANAAMNSLDRLSGMSPDLGYNLSNIPVIGDIATLGGNDYESEARSLAQQIGYMVSGANIKEEEAANIGKAYVPQPWDSESTRRSKLQRAREIIQQYQNGMAEEA